MISGETPSVRQSGWSREGGGRVVEAETNGRVNIEPFPFDASGSRLNGAVRSPTLSPKWETA